MENIQQDPNQTFRSKKQYLKSEIHWMGLKVN